MLNGTVKYIHEKTFLLHFVLRDCFETHLPCKNKIGFIKLIQNYK